MFTEKAMNAMVERNHQKAAERVEKAKPIARSAVEEVIKDLAEDAGSDHGVPDENR